MLFFGVTNMNVLPYSSFRFIASARRLENVRSQFYVTLLKREKNNAWKPSFRYFTTKKDENSSAPSMSSSSSSSSSSESSSSDSSSSDEEDEKESPRKLDPKGDEKHASSSITNERLQYLLKTMIDGKGQEHSVSSMLLKEAEKQVEVKDASRSSNQTKRKNEIFGEDLGKAAQKVAENLGGDVQKTESELLNKLLSRNEQTINSSEKASINLSELIAGMKIDRTPASNPEHSYPSIFRAGREQYGERRSEQRGEQRVVRVKFTTRQEREQRPLQSIEKRVRSRISEPSVDLFGGEKLGIFDPTLEYVSQPPLKTWQHLHQREMSLSVTHPPANFFEEMILWTEKGMLWKFPINNEQGLEEESSVPFSEHVFLEKHLVPWCPSKGPIRHFMELVCVGLSKNSYLKVEEKKETILWYRDYFENKRDVLKNAGIDMDAKVTQIEAQ